MQYEIRAMSLAEILDTALRLVSNHFLLFVGLIAVANVPTAMVVEYMTPDMSKPGGADGVGFYNSVIAMFLIVSLMVSVLYPIAIAAMTYAIAEQYRGREVGFGDCLRYAIANLWPLVITTVLAGLLTLLAVICLILPGIYVWLALLALWPVMVVEQRYGMEAIRRSRALMTGNLLRGFGIVLVATLIGMVLGGAAQLALGQIPLVNLVAAPLIQSITGAYAAAAQLVLYFDIRCRKEGFDIEHLAARVEQQGVVVGESA